MKRFISAMMLFAAAAMAFVSCQKQEMEGSEMLQVSGLTFTSEKPAFDDDTKTEWTGETIQWSKGDAIRVAYTCDGVWQNADGTAKADEANGEKSAKIYASSAHDAASAVAQFNVPGSFKGTAEGNYEFYGVYPSSAVGSADLKFAPSVTVNIPAAQTPLAASFDPKADLMAAQSATAYTGIPTEDPISLEWTRIVAHGNITLKGLKSEEGEVISTITLTANAEADMVGSHYLYLDTYNVTKPSGNNAPNVLTLDASNLTLNNGNVEFWACFLPCTWTSLTVVVETDKATYTREITGISKTFKQNARNTLAIKMDAANREAKEVIDYSGTYAIVAYRNSESKYYYLTNIDDGASTKRFKAEVVGDVLPEEGVSLSAAKLWKIATSDAYYTVQSLENNKFISWSSGNSATLSADGLKFFISSNEDGTCCLKSSDRYLSLNTNKGNNYFAMYLSGQIMNLYLVPAVEGEEVLELSSISVSGQKTSFVEGDSFEFRGIVTATYTNGSTKDVTANVSVTKPNMEDGATVTVSYTEGTITRNFVYTISVKAEGFEVEELSETLDLTSGYSNGDEVSKVEGTVVSVEFNKGSSNNSPKWYNTGTAIRVYGGGNFVVSASEKTITNIEVTYNKQGSNSISVNIGSVSDDGSKSIWTGESSSVTFSVGGTSGHRRIQKITVTYIN